MLTRERRRCPFQYALGAMETPLTAILHNNSRNEALVPFLFARRGHRVVTAGAPGVAAPQPARAQAQRAHEAVLAKGFHRIVRTGRLVPTPHPQKLEQGRKGELVSPKDDQGEASHPAASIWSRQATAASNTRRVEAWRAG